MRRRKGKVLAKETYSAWIARLLGNLVKTLSEVNSILVEIARVAHERKAAVSKLEQDINGLETNEKEYKARIETLKNVPVPAIDHLLKELQPTERRSASRDYALFIAGVFASAIITIMSILKSGR